jgi:hypothetical protein
VPVYYCVVGPPAPNTGGFTRDDFAYDSGEEELKADDTFEDSGDNWRIRSVGRSDACGSTLTPTDEQRRVEPLVLGPRSA